MLTVRPPRTHSRRSVGARAERGVILIYTLIVLLILVIGAVALMKSTQVSLFSAGNLSFRSDLINQGEQADAKVMTQFESGGALSTSAVTVASVPALNYSATTLPTNAQGVPTALLSDAAFATVGTAANDLNGATSDVTIRYVIDRLCTAVGTVNGSLCVQSSAAPIAVTATGGPQVPPPAATVYRLSIRVTGARGTQVFMQSTFTRAD
jgi:Tfp pilus assembly protein PilX